MSTKAAKKDSSVKRVVSASGIELDKPSEELVQPPNLLDNIKALVKAAIQTALKSRQINTLLI